MASHSGIQTCPVCCKNHFRQTSGHRLPRSVCVCGRREKKYYTHMHTSLHPPRVHMLRRVALVAACALLLCVPVAAEDEEWIEFYDKASNKMAYYHSKTRESAWEPPEGAKVKYVTSDSTSAQSTPAKGGKSLAFMIVVLPIVLVFGGLYVLYYMASQEGLLDALKNRKKDRERAHVRCEPGSSPPAPLRRPTHACSPPNAAPAPRARSRRSGGAPRPVAATRPSTSSRRTARGADPPTPDASWMTGCGQVRRRLGMRTALADEHIIIAAGLFSTRQAAEWDFGAKPSAGRC